MRKIFTSALVVLAVLPGQPANAAEGRHTAAFVGAGAGLLVGGLVGAFLSSPSQQNVQPQHQVVHVIQPPQPMVIQYITVQPGSEPPSVVSRWYCNCVDTRR